MYDIWFIISGGWLRWLLCDLVRCNGPLRWRVYRSMCC